MAVDIAVAGGASATGIAVATRPSVQGHRFASALREAGLSVIAEIKRRSPSRGPMNPDLDAGDLAVRYQRGGATCLSILTEGERFGGSPDDLRAAKAAADVPVLRKDFLRSLDDVRESAAMGADAMLVILAEIDPSQFLEMQDHALSLGIDVLTEVRDEDEFQLAVDLGAYMIAVNQRDLPQSKEYTVDPNKAVRISSCFEGIDEQILLVAASGIGVRDGTSMSAIAEAGYDAALIGEELVTADDPEQRLYELRIEARSS